jgi:hypothetical protein
VLLRRMIRHKYLIQIVAAGRELTVIPLLNTLFVVSSATCKNEKLRSRSSPCGIPNFGTHADVSSDFVRKEIA